MEDDDQKYVRRPGPFGGRTPKLTRQTILSKLRYYPEEGLFRWPTISEEREKSRSGFSPWTGHIFGSFSGKSGGVRRGHLDGVSVSVPDMVWFISTGEWPKYVLGFKNGDSSDSRFENLEYRLRASRGGPGPRGGSRERVSLVEQRRSLIELLQKSGVSDEEITAATGVKLEEPKAEKQPILPPIEPKDILELFIYEPETGDLVWAKDPHPEFHVDKFPGVGMVAFRSTGNGDHGRLKINGQWVQKIKAVWAWHHGEWPDGNLVLDNAMDGTLIDNMSVIPREED